MLTASESDDGELNWALTSLALAFSVLYVLMQVYLFLRMLHRQLEQTSVASSRNGESSSLKDIASATAKNTKYARDSLKYSHGPRGERRGEVRSRRDASAAPRAVGARLERNEWFACVLVGEGLGRQIFRQQANQGEHVGGKLDAIMQRLERLESTRHHRAERGG